jgi:hypothetical protein
MTYNKIALFGMFFALLGFSIENKPASLTPYEALELKLEEKESELEDETIFAAEQTEKLDAARKRIGDLVKDVATQKLIVENLRAESRGDAFAEDAADADRCILQVKLTTALAELSKLKTRLAQADLDKKDLAKADSTITRLDSIIADLRVKVRQLESTAAQPNMIFVPQEDSGLQRLLSKEKKEVKFLKDQLAFSALTAVRLRSDKATLQRNVNDANRRAANAEVRADRREKAAGVHVRAADLRQAKREAQMATEGGFVVAIFKENNEFQNAKIKAENDLAAGKLDCNSKLAAMRAKCEEEKRVKDKECGNKLLWAGAAGAGAVVLGGAIVLGGGAFLAYLHG